MEALTPYLVALVIQVTYTGMFLITKLAFDVGMNTFVFVFYRQLFGAAILAPVAFFLERKTAPRFTFKTFAMLFVVCLFGMTISLNLYGVGVRLTNATLAAAASNSLPVSTFILALIFRMEKVKLKKMTGIVKILGVCLCAGGAATIALYTGPTLKLLLHHHLFKLHGRASQSSSSSGKKWILGVFLTFFSNVLWSLWIVIQSRVLRRYPSKLLSTTIQACISSIQTFVVALIFERDFDEWKLGWNIRLLAVAYCGIVVTGLAFYLQTWVVQKKGPVFLSVTTPLALIFTMAFSAFFFGSILSLGSILGAVFLIGGLYCVMWGKSKEQKLLAANNNHTANPTVGSEKGYESTEETNAPTPPHPGRLSTSEV